MSKKVFIIVILCILLFKYSNAIHDPSQSDDGIKSKGYHQELQFSQKHHGDTVEMHHKYSRVAKYSSSLSDKEQQNISGQHANSHISHRDGKLSKNHEIDNSITEYYTECPKDSTGQFPYLMDCRQFLNCWNGRGYVQSCAPGTLFNSETMECDNPSKVKCHAARSKTQLAQLQRYSNSPAILNTERKIKCASSYSTIEPHPYDCTKFLNCANGITYIQSCGPGTVFNSRILVCDHPRNVDCFGKSEIIENQKYGRKPKVEAHINRKYHHSFQRTPGIQYEGHNPSHQSNSFTGIINPNNFQNTNFGKTWSYFDNGQTIQSFDIRNGIVKEIPLESESSDSFVNVYYAIPIENLEENINSNIGDGSLGNFDVNDLQQRIIPDHFLPTPLSPLYVLKSSTNKTPLVFNHSKYNPLISDNINPVDTYKSEGLNSESSHFSRKKEHEINKNTKNPLFEFDQSNFNSYISGGDSPDVFNEDDLQQKIVPNNFFSTSLSSSRAEDFKEDNLQQRLIPEDFITQASTSSHIPNNWSSQTSENHKISPPKFWNMNMTIPLSHNSLSSDESKRVIGLPEYRTSTEVNDLHRSAAQSIIQPTPNKSLHLTTTSNRGNDLFAISTTTKSNIHPIYNRPTATETVAVEAKSSHNDKPYVENSFADNSNNEFSKNSDILMNEAIKALLRPYFNRSITDNVVNNMNGHIMKLTKSNNTKHGDDKIVEFIFAGEQDSLNEGNEDTTTTQNFSNEQIDLGIRTTTRKYNHFPYHRNHQSHNHNYHFNHHRNEFGHSFEFHKKHPHLKNPFDDPSEITTQKNVFPSTTLKISRTIPMPTTSVSRGFSTTPFHPTSMYQNENDDLSLAASSNANKFQSVCDFDCNNRKCVKDFEVCDGVDNCGNGIDEQSCDHLGYEVRLSSEDGHKNAGRVEVKSKWGYVCDDKFGMRDADVLCRELGYTQGANEVRGNSYYPPNVKMIGSNNHVPFVMDEVECLGNETSLKECKFKGWGIHDCSDDEIVGVECKIPVMRCPNDYWLCKTTMQCIPPAFLCDNVPDCSDASDENDETCNAPIEYRLVDGKNKFEGRIEVKYRGVWGTVCDDDFRDVGAQIACKKFGYNGKAKMMKNKFGPGSGPIWLDQVSCIGNETELSDCTHALWGEHNCNHTEDVSIECSIGTFKHSSNNYNPKPPKVLESSLPDNKEFFKHNNERSGRLLDEPPICGHISANLMHKDDNFEYHEKVINGLKAERGHHPWQASLRVITRSGKSSHWCGAVLIGKKHILTAAHCLIGFAKGAYFIRLGDHYSEIAEPSEIDVFIEKWFLHEDFRKDQHMNNDIALVQLKQSVRFNDYVRPICLPKITADYSMGKNCTISGWGSIQSGISTPSNHLRAAKIPILPQEICKQSNVYGTTITEGMFCAGFLDEGIDACDGDSGGPLVCTDNNAQTLYGIISWGQHCGYANKPGVYVKVSHYLNWIQEKVKTSIFE